MTCVKLTEINQQNVPNFNCHLLTILRNSSKTEIYLF